MPDHPEDDTSPEPEGAPSVETGRRFVTGLRNFLMDPKVYLPAIGALTIWLATVIYGYYKPNIAHHIAEMVTQYDEFPGENGEPNVKNPLLEKMETVFADRLNGTGTGQLIDRRIDTHLGSPEAQKALMDALIATLAEEGASSALKHEIGEMVVTALLEFDGNLEKNAELDEMLRNMIRDLISEQMDRIGSMEREYGRVDTVFTETVKLDPDSDPPQVIAEIRFAAEKDQQVQLLVNHELLITRDDGTVRKHKLEGFLISGNGYLEIRDTKPHDITSIVRFTPDRHVVQPQTIGISSITPLAEGEVAVVDVTLIVRNSLPAGEPRVQIGAGGAGGLGND